MASTRSTSKTRRGSQRPAASKTPKQALLALALDGARVQIALATTAAKTLTDWAETTDRFAQAVGDELLRRLNRESGSAELSARITAAAGVHLRDLTALPHAGVDHFEARLARVPIDN
ncbi:MAG TPA: hypothetical protein VFJ20_16420 [Gemmatimonadaceae bacterium]|nr:hypothetical protein [Gemmatimonadaceae bacterium]